MSQSSSTTLLILAQALKGLEDSKGHLKKAAREFLLAAQTIASTATTIALDTNLIDQHSPFREAFKKGEVILNEVIRNISEDEEEKPKHPASETAKISRLPTKRKHSSHKKG